MTASLPALRAKHVTEQDLEPLAAAEIVLLQGDLSVLSAAQRVDYYGKVCQSVGLNPLTKPFDYIVLNGKLTLYAKKDATDQLRGIHGISIIKLERELSADSYDVTAYGRDRLGREDASLGSVSMTGLKGEALANAKMKAETKAKRRLTLSLAGLGWLDETEVGSVPSAQPVIVTDTGEVSAVVARPTFADAIRARLSDGPGEPVVVEVGADTVETPDGKGDTTETVPTNYGLTQAELLSIMRSRGLLPGALLAVAARIFGPSGSGTWSATSRVADLTDAQRLELWERVSADLGIEK